MKKKILILLTSALLLIPHDVCMASDTKNYNVGNVSIDIPIDWAYKEGKNNISYYYPEEGSVDGKTYSMLMTKYDVIEKANLASKTLIEECFDSFEVGLSESDFEYIDSIKGYEINNMQSRMVFGTQVINGETYDVTNTAFMNYDNMIVVSFVKSQNHDVDYSIDLEKIILSVSDMRKGNDEAKENGSEWDQKSEDESQTEPDVKYTIFSSGKYKVGSDIPEGEYVVFAESGRNGYFCVSPDSNQDNITFNENFSNNSIITIKDGEYVELSGCYAIPYSENPNVNISGDGMFKVGAHIPSGEYKLEANGEHGYYCIYSDSRQNDIVSNENFEGQSYVTVSDGQYLLLSRCKFSEPPEKTYTDADTVKKVQEALNAAGYDCGSPDGIAGDGTKGQIRKYQTDNGLRVTGTITDDLINSLGI